MGRRGFRVPTEAVRFQPAAANRKLGPLRYEPHKERMRPVPVAPFVSSTYVSIGATCPDSCTFKRAGCYVEEGFTAEASRMMDKAARGKPGVAVIRQEAIAIMQSFGRGRIPQDGARGGRDLRLHVGGDVANTEGAELLAEAARGWRERGGGSVWTFTHWWRQIPRAWWGPAISVLASVETVDDFPFARRMGYAPAIVVGELPNGDRAFTAGGLRIIPCPAETKGKTCSSCRLCLDRDLIEMNAAIAFQAHGRGAAELRKRLPVLQ